jgi:hypothetical protein
MSAFDLRDKDFREPKERKASDMMPLGTSMDIRSSSAMVKDEPLITFKIYDSIRVQECCTPKQLGPARAAKNETIRGINFSVGEIIIPPHDAAAVTIEHLKAKDVIIVSKHRNPFKRGFWDLDLKYIFEYRLIFRESDGSIIGDLLANSIFNKRVTMFGSTGTDLMVVTDLFPTVAATIDEEPFVMIESKAVPLAADIKYCKCNPCSDSHKDESGTVDITIGLFSIIKLFRMVDLVVESKGFYIPEECDESPIRPCEFFDEIDFPMDIFNPPQKHEFFAGIRGDIPRERRYGRDKDYENYYCKKVKPDDEDDCADSCHHHNHHNHRDYMY